MDDVPSSTQLVNGWRIPVHWRQIGGGGWSQVNAFGHGWWEMCLEAGEMGNSVGDVIERGRTVIKSRLMRQSDYLCM